ncbi:MAG: LysR family transcriptional regulator [Marinobacterium sp.]|nr:LysR family transcriptional regulator [Marinobacterium sp.]
MNLRNVDLNTLVILDALLETRHVSQAATKLCMSQPAVSRQLKKLRELFNDPLLISTADGYILSDKALHMRQQLSSVLESLSDLLDNEAFHPNHARETLRIYGLEAESSAFLMLHLPRLQKDAPCMRFEILSQPGCPFKLLERGEVHLVISGLEPDHSTQQLYHHPLCHTRFVCIMGQHNPLAQRQQLTLEEYLACNHGVVSITGTGASEIDRILAQTGLKRQVAFWLPNFSLAAGLCEQTNTILAVPLVVAEFLQGRYNLHTCELPATILPPPFVIQLYWHQRHHQNAMCRWARQQIITAEKAVSARRLN